MRSRSRRTFTVEVRSDVRRLAAGIPSRVAPPVVPQPRAFQVLPAEPLVEKRRILPSLIVQDAPQAEPMLSTEESPPRRGRGRPRKEPQPPVVREREFVAPAVAAVAPQPAAPSPMLPARSDAVKRAFKPEAALAPGERWKRRLSRWSR